MIPLGISLMMVGLIGRSSARFYSAVKTGKAFTQSETILGNYYKGGFQDIMSRREAALILGVRETSDENKIM